MSLLGLVVAILVFFVLVWATQTLATVFNIPPQVKMVVLVLLVVVFAIWFLEAFGLATVPVIRPR